MRTETQKRNNRFKDENYTLSNFQNEIFVECPNCSKRATVTKETPFSYYSERTISCPNCHFSQKGRKQNYRVELNCNCSNCSKEINLIIPSVNEKKEKIAIKCKNCGKTQEYAPRNIAQEWIYRSNGKPSDDYFGLPLWISSNFKDYIFWAYNYEHLNYLKLYISAEIRESNNRTHWTMIEKLPVWMSSAKNREKLMKIIKELEIK